MGYKRIGRPPLDGSNGECSDELWQFIVAVDEEKKRQRLPMLSTSEVYAVVRRLGYRRPALDIQGVPAGDPKREALVVKILRATYRAGVPVAREALRMEGFEMSYAAVVQRARRLGLKVDKIALCRDPRRSGCIKVKREAST